MTSILPPERYRNDLLSLYIQMLERRHSQQAGIFYDHLMILYHVKEMRTINSSSLYK